MKTTRIHTIWRKRGYVRILLAVLAVSLICILAACSGATLGADDGTGPVTGPTTEQGTAEQGTADGQTPSDSAPEGTDATDEPGSSAPAETKQSGTLEQPGQPSDPNLHPGDASAYEGLMIASVYGTGKSNTDAAMSAGFVQLYNAGDRALSLAGASLYYKSDDAAPYTQFAFPADAVIPAGGYYLVRANAVEGYDESMAVIGLTQYDAEWDVTIDNREIRLLLAPSMWVIGKDEDILSFDDAISVFVATESYSGSVYAVDNMSKNKVAVRTALTEYSGYHTVNLTERTAADLARVAPRTADGTVNAVIASRLLEVSFSYPAGVYSEALSLELEAPEGYTIYYTTDGSEPSPQNGSRYRGALTLNDSSDMPLGDLTRLWAQQNGGSGYHSRPGADSFPGGYVIKAMAASGDRTVTTPVYTNTYFIIPNMSEYGVPVVSISIPEEDMLGSDGFYNHYHAPAGGSRPRGTGVMEVFAPDGTRVGNSVVEMAVSGNGSAAFSMRSLRIYYKGSLNETGGHESDLNYDLFEGRALDNRGQAITSFSRLLLRNAGNDCGDSYIRDAYMQRVSSDLNVDTMASAAVMVFINGEFWGTYNARERYSPEYVESHYGVDKDNVTVLENDYSRLFTDANAPYVVSSGEEGDADPFNALVNYMKSHDLSDPAAYAYVCEQLDIASFIDSYVVRLFFNARDWPENNIKIWRNKNPDDPSGFDTKWHFTLLDLDMGLDLYGNEGETTDIYGRAFNYNSVCANMMMALLENSSFREQFVVRYYEVVKEHFTVERLTEVFNGIYAEWEPLIPLQADRWPGDGAGVSRWYRVMDRIPVFLRDREPYALEKLYSYFNTSEDEILNNSLRRVTVTYNDDRAAVTVNGEAIGDGQVISFEENSRELTVSVTAKEGYLVSAIVWIARDGTAQRVEGSEATFTVTESGSIVVYTKRDKADGEEASGQLIAGATYLFYLTEDGDLYAWGDNRNNVLGLSGAPETVATPTLVMRGVAKVATSHGLAYESGDSSWMAAIVTTDGKLYTVGTNAAGQLGRNGTADSYTLQQASFGGRAVDVSVGHDHMLVLDENGVLWGVGSNTYGQLGSSNMGSSAVTTFQRVADGVVSMTAGRRCTAYITEGGNLYGMGDNRWKKLSQNHGDRVTTPVLMLRNVAYIASGEHQMVAVTEDGDLYYAGWRDFGTFLQGAGNNPTMYRVMGGVVKADIYFGNLIILTEDGTVYGYGLNTEGGLGSSTVTGGTPVVLYSDTTVLDIASGYGFTAILCDDGFVRILGDNTYGQAGNGQIGGKVFFSEADV